MSYHVVETIQSILEAEYDDVQDFEDNVIYDGVTSRSEFTTYTYNKLIQHNLATQEEADRYVQVMNSVTRSDSAWDITNQSFVKTRTFASEDDYIFLEDMHGRAYSYFRNIMRPGLYTVTRHTD
jgi:hypothetical protein